MTKCKTLNKINEFIVLLIIRLAQRAGLFRIFFFLKPVLWPKSECFHCILIGRELQLKMEFKYWMQRVDLVVLEMFVSLLLLTDM